MTNKYTIKYTYDSYEEGCGCCSYSEQTLIVLCPEGYVELETDNIGVWAENEKELREYINEKYPEYSDFEVHEDSRWF